MNDEEMSHYSAALDEVFRLRRALAYEAAGLRVHLDYATFPKSRHKVAEGQVERMQAAARGEAEAAYAGIPSSSLRHTFLISGAKETLTRSAWEQRSARSRTTTCVPPGLSEGA
jgi:hypothetical protein